MHTHAHVPWCTYEGQRIPCRTLFPSFDPMRTRHQIWVFRLGSSKCPCTELSCWPRLVDSEGMCHSFHSSESQHLTLGEPENTATHLFLLISVPASGLFTIDRWLSTFLMWLYFKVVPHIAVIPDLETIFITTSYQQFRYCCELHCKYLISRVCFRQSLWGCDPQVENHR